MPASNRKVAIRLVEVLVVIGLVLFLIALLLRSTVREREVSTTISCRYHLKEIGQAILLYANDNHGAYPRTYFTGGDDPLPDTSNYGYTATDPFMPNGGWFDRSPPAGSNIPSSLFLLMRTQDIPAAVFVCPSSNADADDFGGGTNTAQNRCNFSDVHKNLSYAFADPFAGTVAIKKGYELKSNIDPGFAVAADIGPGTGRGSNLLTITTSSSGQQMRSSNSKNHNGDGQEVLYGDGHVEYQNTCLCGINRDNIYTCNFNGAGPGQSIEHSPLDANDSFLLPTDDN